MTAIPTHTATIHTNLGDIVVNLFGNHAPKTVKNFVGFMIQGGDPLGQGTGGPGYRFDDEINPELDFREPYKLAMANAGIQMGQGTNGSQFFITSIPTTWLQGKHTIFGDVTDEASRKLVDQLNVVPTDGRDKPLEDVSISSIDVTAL